MNFFSMPEIYEDEAKVTARLIYFISAALIVSSIFFVLILPVIAPELTRRVTILMLIATPTNLVVIGLVRSKKLRIAGILLTLLIWLIVTVESILAG